MPPILGKKLCKINGKGIEYANAGNGDPTVLFIHGGGSVNMDSWDKVYALTKKFTRVFAYNRYGDGNSDQVNKPQTGKRIVETLRQLLQYNQVIAPYVLVGHSLGGLYANLFARLHPNEVAGVVLVDSSHPAQAEMMRGKKGILETIYLLSYRLIVILYARFNPSKASELVSFDETASQINRAEPFPNVPLIVVTAGRRLTHFATNDDVKKIEFLQKDLSLMSPQGRQVFAVKSGHCIQNDEPDTIVKAIHEIIKSAKAC